MWATSLIFTLIKAALGRILSLFSCKTRERLHQLFGKERPESAHSHWRHTPTNKLFHMGLVLPGKKHNIKKWTQIKRFRDIKVFMQYVCMLYILYDMHSNIMFYASFMAQRVARASVNFPKALMSDFSGTCIYCSWYSTMLSAKCETGLTQRLLKSRHYSCRMNVRMRVWEKC